MYKLACKWIGTHHNEHSVDTIFNPHQPTGINRAKFLPAFARRQQATKCNKTHHH
jgi:hypothetical protein